jgi:hypothetical protein
MHTTAKTRIPWRQMSRQAIARELARAAPGKPRRLVIEALIADLGSSMRIDPVDEPPPPKRRAARRAVGRRPA